MDTQNIKEKKRILCVVVVATGITRTQCVYACELCVVCTKKPQGENMPVRGCVSLKKHFYLLPPLIYGAEKHNKRYYLLESSRESENKTTNKSGFLSSFYRERFDVRWTAEQRAQQCAGWSRRTWIGSELFPVVDVSSLICAEIAIPSPRSRVESYEGGLYLQFSRVSHWFYHTHYVPPEKVCCSSK